MLEVAGLKEQIPWKWRWGLGMPYPENPKDGKSGLGCSRDFHGSEGPLKRLGGCLVETKLEQRKNRAKSEKGEVREKGVVAKSHRTIAACKPGKTKQ